MTYKFDQFNVEIVNPTVTVKTGGFNLENGMTSSDVLLTDGEGTKFGVTLTDNTQPEAWSVEALTAWVMVQLAKYEV